MRFIVRLIAFLFLLAALAALAVGVFLVVSGADIGLPAGQLWVEIDTPSLNLAEAIVDRYVAPAVFYPDLWYDVAVPMLTWPAWQTVLAILGAFGLVGLLLWRLGGIGRGRRATQPD